jgi:hypothetical protein
VERLMVDSQAMVEHIFAGSWRKVNKNEKRWNETMSD